MVNAVSIGMVNAVSIGYFFDEQTDRFFCFVDVTLGLEPYMLDGAAVACGGAYRGRVRGMAWVVKGSRDQEGVVKGLRSGVDECH